MISLISAKNEAKPSLESLVILPLVGFDRSRGRGVSLTNKPGPLPLRVKHLPLPLLVEDASFRGQATESSGGKPSLPLPPGVRSPRPYEAINGDLSPPPLPPLVLPVYVQRNVVALRPGVRVCTVSR